MKLYFVYNGWMGGTAVHVAVVAKDEETALRLAKEIYKREAEKSILYGENYYAKLSAELVGEVGEEGIASESID